MFKFKKICFAQINEFAKYIYIYIDMEFLQRIMDFELVKIEHAVSKFTECEHHIVYLKKGLYV